MKVGENMRIPEPILAEDFYMVKRIGGDVTLPAPRTRFEKLLYIYAGGTIERPTPKTVEERFLDYITGGESELPDPKTRLQSYMYNVANPLNKIPIVPPKTRFECYWFVMATANAVISTDNPVEFTSVDGFLLDYTIWGNTEQNLTEIEIGNVFTNGYSLDRETGLPINTTGRVATINPVYFMQGTYNVEYSVNVDWHIGVIYTIIDGDTLVQRTLITNTKTFNISLIDNYSVYFCVYPETGSTDKIVTTDIINSFKITAIDGQICPSPDYQIDVKGVGDYSANKYIISMLSTGQENSQSITKSIVLDEPIYKIDNYTDSVNYLAQKETRKIKKVVVDGAITCFNTAVNYGLYRYGVGIQLTEPETITQNVFSNVGIRGSSAVNNPALRNLWHVIETPTIKLYIFFPKNYIDIESPTENQIINFFNNKAQELYNNGKPIIFYFVSTTNEESAVELPKIQTYDPTTELTIETEIAPSQIEVVTRTE